MEWHRQILPLEFACIFIESYGGLPSNFGRRLVRVAFLLVLYHVVVLGHEAWFPPILQLSDVWLGASVFDRGRRFPQQPRAVWLLFENWDRRALRRFYSCQVQQSVSTFCDLPLFLNIDTIVHVKCCVPTATNIQLMVTYLSLYLQ